MYVKLIDGIIQEAPKNKDNIINYNLDIEQMILDGYKLFVLAQIPQTNRIYHIEYTETADKIIEELIYDETQQEADIRQRNEEIQEKLDYLHKLKLDNFDKPYMVDSINDIIRGLEANIQQ